MDFWPEFLASSWGREFVAGGFGGIAGIISGYPLDTLRIRQQSSKKGSAFGILRHVVAKEGPFALYRGMAAPLASVTFQNAMVFQIYAVFSRACDPSVSVTDPPSYKGVALGGFTTGRTGQDSASAPKHRQSDRISSQRSLSSGQDYMEERRSQGNLQRSRHHCAQRRTFPWLLLLDLRVHERTTSPRLQKKWPRKLEHHANGGWSSWGSELGLLLSFGCYKDETSSSNPIFSEVQRSFGLS